MAIIDNMLRQHRWQLEERQRYLNGLEALALRLRGDVRRLESEAERETQRAGRPLDSGPVGIEPVFLRPLIERRDKLNHSVVELDSQIAEARAFVESARQELKIYELSSTQRDRPPLQPLTRRSRRLQQLRQRQAALRSGEI